MHGFGCSMPACIQVVCMCVCSKKAHLLNSSSMPCHTQVFKARESLMSRANSLKKAVRQIIEHTEKGENKRFVGRGGVVGFIVLYLSSCVHLQVYFWNWRGEGIGRYICTLIPFHSSYLGVRCLGDSIMWSIQEYQCLINVEIIIQHKGHIESFYFYLSIMVKQIDHYWCSKTLLHASSEVIQHIPCFRPWKVTEFFSSMLNETWYWSQHILLLVWSCGWAECTDTGAGDDAGQSTHRGIILKRGFQVSTQLCCTCCRVWGATGKTSAAPAASRYLVCGMSVCVCACETQSERSLTCT